MTVLYTGEIHENARGHYHFNFILEFDNCILNPVLARVRTLKAWREMIAISRSYNLRKRREGVQRCIKPCITEPFKCKSLQ